MPKNLIDQYTRNLPESFPGKEIDVLTAKALRWRTIQNRRSKGEIPLNCFIKISPRKTLILRDHFLAWLEGQLDFSKNVGQNKPTQTDRGQQWNR